MQKLYTILLGVVLATPCLVTAEQSATVEIQSTFKTVSIPVKGMMCSACAARVTKALSTMEGVKSVKVSGSLNTARVTYADTKITPEQLCAAISKLGFQAGSPELTN